jgi:hypothetical protein
MELSKDVKTFGKACEHLLCRITLHRLLTEEERLFVRHYCNELLEKTAQCPSDPVKGREPVATLTNRITDRLKSSSMKQNRRV